MQANLLNLSLKVPKTTLPVLCPKLLAIPPWATLASVFLDLSLSRFWSPVYTQNHLHFPVPTWILSSSWGFPSHPCNYFLLFFFVPLVKHHSCPPWVPGICEGARSPHQAVNSWRTGGCVSNHLCIPNRGKHSILLNAERLYLAYNQFTCLKNNLRIILSARSFLAVISHGNVFYLHYPL